MTRKALLRRAFPAAAALAASAVFAPVPVAAAELVCRSSSAYCAEVNGAYAPGARFFETDTKGKFLVDIPSLSKSIFINLKSRKAVAVPRSSLAREAADGIVRVARPIPSDVPVYPLSIEGEVIRFQIDSTEVRILSAASCQPIVVPIWNAASVTDDSSARRCLRQEAKSFPASYGCTKSAYLKNTCDVAVVAVVRSMQHLFSGDLAETSTIVLPPGVEHSLGCVWLSGASAPTTHELLAAAFPPKQTMAEAERRDSTKP